MKRLLVLIVALALGYSGYWFVGARTMKSTAIDTFADMQDAGWAVRYDKLNTRGFPSRFDTTVMDLDLQSPDGRIRYAAPFLQVFALSYRPNHIIAAFPPTQEVTVAGTRIAFESEALKLSARLAADVDLSLEETTATAEVVRLLLPEGQRIKLGPTLMALRAGATDTEFDAFARSETITLPIDLWRTMFPQEDLPLDIGEVRIDAIITTDTGISRTSLARPGGPRVTAIALKDAVMNWGDTVLALSGDLEIDTAGVPTGQLRVEMTAWEPLLTGLSNAGLIDANQLQLLENMGRAMAAGAETLDIPLTFRDGLIYIGPIPVGPVPRFL